MKIQVTEEDIKNGVRHFCSSCPVALAIKKLYPAETWVSVSARRVVIEETSYDLPEVAITFIQMFDKGQKVEPITFDLPLPDSLQSP